MSGLPEPRRTPGHWPTASSTSSASTTNPTSNDSPGLGRSSSASPPRSASRCRRTGHSRSVRQRGQRRATGCASRAKCWCSARRRACRRGPTGAPATSSPRRPPTGARWPAPTATCPGARATPTRSPCSSTSSGSVGYLARHAARQGPKTDAQPVRPGRLGLRHRRERRLLGRRAGVRQRPRPGRPCSARLPNAKAASPRSSSTATCSTTTRAAARAVRFTLMPQARAKLVDVRTSPDRRAHRRDRRLRRGRLRGAPQLQPRHRPRGLAGGLGGAVRADRRDASASAARRSSPPRSSSSPTTRGCTRSTWAGTPRPRSCCGARTSRRPSAGRAGSGTSATDAGWKGRWVAQLVELLADEHADLPASATRSDRARLSTAVAVAS